MAYGEPPAHHRDGYTRRLVSCTQYHLPKMPLLLCEQVPSTCHPFIDHGPQVLQQEVNRETANQWWTANQSINEAANQFISESVSIRSESENSSPSKGIMSGDYGKCSHCMWMVSSDQISRVRSWQLIKRHTAVRQWLGCNTSMLCYIKIILQRKNYIDSIQN